MNVQIPRKPIGWQCYHPKQALFIQWHIVLGKTQNVSSVGSLCWTNPFSLLWNIVFFTLVTRLSIKLWLRDLMKNMKTFFLDDKLGFFFLLKSLDSYFKKVFWYQITNPCVFIISVVTQEMFEEACNETNRFTESHSNSTDSNVMCVLIWHKLWIDDKQNKNLNCRFNFI